jgi:hypothetical protein
MVGGDFLRDPVKLQQPQLLDVFVEMAFSYPVPLAGKYRVSSRGSGTR